jgi:hypothetical protein
MRKSEDVDRFDNLGRGQSDAVWADPHLAACFSQLFDEHCQMSRFAVFHRHRFGSQRGGDEEGACFDAVRDHGHFHRKEVSTPSIVRVVLAFTADLCAHLVQDIDGGIYFRLHRSIEHPGGSFGKHSRHQSVDRGADAGLFKVYVGRRSIS